jgi:hypothetical protein
MGPSEAIVLDGFLEEDTAPGDAADVHETTARFRLTVSPTDDRTDETTLACVASDPLLARAVLHELCQGDRLRVTGYLRLPRTPDQAVRLHVHRIEVLATAPLLDLDVGTGSANPSGADEEAAALADGGLIGRHGAYATYRDPRRRDRPRVEPHWRLGRHRRRHPGRRPSRDRRPRAPHGTRRTLTPPAHHIAHRRRAHRTDD